MAWYPKAGSYYKYLQNSSYVDDVRSEISHLKKNIESNISNQTRELIANQNQIAEVYNNRLDKISHAIENGFSSVTAAIQDFHSDFNEKMESVIERLDLINNNLEEIVYALHNPGEMHVNELYIKGCRLKYEGILNKAEKMFLDALAIDETDFPTHLELGKLYLNGYDKETGISVYNIEKANYHLLQASTVYGRGKLRSNPASKEIVSVAFLYASRSFYVRTESNYDLQYLNRAIDLALESIKINPLFSQAYFYLARYYAVSQKIDEMKFALTNAIEIDRSYFISIDEDETFNSVKSSIEELQKQLWSKEYNKVTPLIKIANMQFSELDKYSFEGSEYKEKFRAISNDFKLAEEKYSLKNYFGFLDAKIILEKLNVQ